MWPLLSALNTSLSEPKNSPSLFALETGIPRLSTQLQTVNSQQLLTTTQIKSSNTTKCSTAWQLWALLVDLFLPYRSLSLSKPTGTSPRTLNGPSRFGRIFLLYMVQKFLVSSQTFSPSVNCLRGKDCLVVILVWAISWAFWASFLHLVTCCNLSSKLGTFEGENVCGVPCGWYPYRSSKGDCFRSAWGLLLCTNSRIAREEV
jgi:hypothetical protein